MGTRALTVILETDGQEICTIYRQFDGYPNGLGEDLKGILSSGPLVNGISERPCFNGMNDLAAQVIAQLKTNGAGKIEAGNVYVHPPGTRDCGEEYIYTVYAKDGQIWLKCEGMTFFGMPGTKQTNMLCLFDGPAKDFDAESMRQAAPKKPQRKSRTMPRIWKHLSADERAHVHLILAVNKARKKEGA